MQRTWIITLALLSWGSFAVAQAPQAKAPAADPAAEVRQMQKRYNEALPKKNLAALRQIWADDYVFTNGSGMVMTKAQRLDNLQSSATEIRSADERDIRVRVYGGDAAVLTSLVVLKARYSGRESSGEYRNTAVWVRTAAGWRMVASQITPITR
jgi:ketosteroid isomerase-like protein